MLQFNPHSDGDYISIYDIDDIGNYNLISNLTGPDLGPRSQSYQSNWDTKIISSPSNKMMVEFITDDKEFSGFLSGFDAAIDYLPVPSQQCELWLDMNVKMIKSPNYPDSYDNNILCKWLITVQHGFHITLIFQEFDVRIFF